MARTIMAAVNGQACNINVGDGLHRHDMTIEVAPEIVDACFLIEALLAWMPDEEQKAIRTLAALIKEKSIRAPTTSYGSD